MHAVHHKQIGSHEINRYTSDLDDLHPRLGFLHRSAQVLEVRIRPVTEAQKQLNEIAPRLAAVIDPKLLDHTSEMISLSNHLVVSLDQAFLSLKLAKNVNREDRLHAIADATTKHIEQLIGAEAEATTRKASVALASIEEALKPYTPNLRAKRLFRRVSKKAR